MVGTSPVYGTSATLTCMIAFGPSTAEARHPLTELWGAERPESVRVAAAFASEAGARTLRSLFPSGELDACGKQFLVGIENGLTQPEALAYLLQLPNSQVRVPFGRKALDSETLRATTFFHPKVYAFRGRTRSTVVSSSANLTQGGLRTNVEQFLAWSGSPEDPTSVGFEAWWRGMWASADVIDAAFIDAYAQVRPAIQPPVERPSRAGPIVESEPAPADLKNAQWMWTEALRPLEGGSHNQLELFLSGYHFFYDEDEPPRDELRSLEFVDVDGRVYDNPDRIVHFNGPPLMSRGNAMWRIRLPTAREGLEGYQAGQVVLRFLRTEMPNRYLLEICELGSDMALDWERASRKIASVPGPPARRMGWA